MKIPAFWQRVLLIALTAFGLIVGNVFGSAVVRLILSLFRTAPRISLCGWAAALFVFGLLLFSFSRTLMEKGLLSPGHRSSVRQLLLRPPSYVRPGWTYRFGLLSLVVAALMFGTVIQAVSTLVGAWVTGDAIRGDALSMHDVWLSLAGFVLLPLIGFALKRLVRLRIAVRESSNPGSYEGLILFLSNPCNARPGVLPPLRPYTWDQFRLDFQGLHIDLESEESAKRVLGANAWLMPVLSIFHQLKLAREARKPLKRVLLIVSTKTADMAPVFIEKIESWIAPEWRPKFTIYPGRGGIDFEDPVALQAAVEAVYKEIEENLTPGKEGVIVDLTGGTKQCSLVAGIASFDPGRVFRYVTPSYEHKQYDFRAEDGPPV